MDRGVAAAARSLDMLVALGMVARAGSRAIAARLLGDGHPVTRRLRRSEDECRDDWIWW